MYIPLHKNGEHVPNEWSAHLCHPQLKSQQLWDLKEYHATINQKALRLELNLVDLDYIIMYT